MTSPTSPTSPLTQLQSELSAFAQPDPASPTTGGGTATPVDSGPLTVIGPLFTALEGVSGIGDAIGALAGGINTGLGDAADVLDKIAEQLASLSSVAGTDASTILTTLQNALSTAGSLVPGSSPVTALQSGSQFFQQLGSLLSDFTDVNDAVTCLFQIAQELRAIGQLPTSAAG